MNPFGLLGEVESDDPSQIVAARPVKSPATVTTAKAVTQVKEAKNENARGGGRGGRGFGPGLDRGGFHRDSAGNENNGNGFFYRHRPAEDGESKKPLERRNYGSTQGSFRGGRRGGFNNGDAAEGEHSKRPYERCSGTGRGNEIKRDGAGQGNWGTASEDIAPVTEEPANENEKVLEAEKQVVDEVTGDSNKDSPVIETEEKPEDKEMTLEEYEIVFEEKRKALLALKAEERKVVVDKEFEKMQLLSNKKSDDEIFVKLGSDKDKRKEAAEKEEKAKKQPVSINKFLKPAERSGGRRGGRGRTGPRDAFTGRHVSAAPSINDVVQFPSLCAK